MFFPYKDDNPRILIPYVTYGIIAVNVFIFAFQFSVEFSDPESVALFIYSFGLIPSDLYYVYLYVSPWRNSPYPWQYVVFMVVWG